MKAFLFFASALASSTLLAVEVNDNGTTGDWQVHQGSTVSSAVEFDPGDPGIAGILPNIGWVSALGFELRGRSSSLDFDTFTGFASFWCLDGSEERFAEVRLDVPHNARITFFRMWGSDSSATQDLTAFLFESCSPELTAGASVNTLLAEITSGGNPGSFSVSTNLAIPQPVTNTQSCSYWARARFAPSCAGSTSMLLRKFRIQYTLAD